MDKIDKAYTVFDIERIIDSQNTPERKRELLNQIKEYPQELFIKTHLCDECKKLKVEVWIKSKEYIT